MKIINHKLCRKVREARRCEICGMSVRATEVFHISACGTSSHKRADVPCNLLAVGSSVPGFGCSCHTRYHGEHVPSREECFKIAAHREGMFTQEAIDAVVELQRQPKPPWPCDRCEVGVKVGRDYFVCLRCGEVIE